MMVAVSCRSLQSSKTASCENTHSVIAIDTSKLTAFTSFDTADVDVALALRFALSIEGSYRLTIRRTEKTHVAARAVELSVIYGLQSVHSENQETNTYRRRRS